MFRVLVHSLLLITLFLSALPALAQETPASRRATISPSVVYLQPGQEQTFTITLSPGHDLAARTLTKVNWAVNDIPGGNPLLGTIDKQGVYHAPAKMPSPCEIHICAEASEAANRYLWATVILGDSPPVYTSRHVWSEAITEADGGTKHLRMPHGIGLDKDENILITDQSRHTALRFTAEGTFIEEIGNGAEHFRGPRIILSDPSGRLFVADDKKEGNCIQIFNAEDELLKGFAPKGSDAGEVIRCHGMDFDPQGRLYTIDVDTARVNVYDPDGVLLDDWGVKGLLPGQLNLPHGLAVDKNGDVFVMNFHGPAQKFTAQGDYLGAFCQGTPPEGTLYFHNLHGDRWGNVYVMARADGNPKNPPQGEAPQAISILKFNNNGDYITSISFTQEIYLDTSAVVDDAGNIFALFVNDKAMGVEIFEEQ